jgi:U1 small nuclear ribonucleoprotein 70kDa
MFIPGGPSMAPFRPPSTTYMPKPELPPHLQSLFNPRPPLPYVKVPVKPKCRPYNGLADYVDMFEEGDPPERVVIETPQEKKIREKNAKLQQYTNKLEEELKNYNPKDSNLESNAFKTLFVCRLAYETTESKLKKEFEVYGMIKSLVLIKNKDGKSCGYGFIEYENEEDYKNAYKHADGKRIDGKRVLVDFERGRTTKGWKPRRLGGGRGNTRSVRPKGEKITAKTDFQYIYDESRGYKAVNSRSRSRSRKRDGRNKNNDFKNRRDDKKNDSRRYENPKSR